MQVDKADGLKLSDVLSDGGDARRLDQINQRARLLRRRRRQLYMLPSDIDSVTRDGAVDSLRAQPRLGARTRVSRI